MFLSHLKRLAYRASNEFLAWHYRSHWGMQIGKGVRISRTAKLDKTNPRGVKIGDFTAVAFDAAIITHDFINGQHRDVKVGANCLIGARSILMPGVTIGDNSIVGIGAVVLADVPPNTVVSGNPARVVERGIITGRWGIRDPGFLRQLGIEATNDVARAPTAINRPSRELLIELLPRHIKEEADLERTFAELGMDSFALITFRAEIEHASRTSISDEDWTNISRPSDILKIDAVATENGNASRGASFEKHLTINMPQMSMKGLSEGWLFREVGDIHWQILTSGLGVKSRDVVNAEGERLYATFTRLKIRSTKPLTAFQENDPLDIRSSMTRFGAGIFFSKTYFSSAEDREVECDVMSSFSKIGTAGDNTSLLKSQPAIPQEFAIPDTGVMPLFGIEYRDRRTAMLADAIFETEYELVPQQDINGVGLLYFATYPVIAEICLSRYLTLEERLIWSLQERDISYFANCGPNDRVIYRIHSSHKTENTLQVESSLTRASDGKRMAVIRQLSLKTG